MYAPAVWLAPMAKVAPTVKEPVPADKADEPPTLSLKPLTVMSAPGPVSVADAGNTTENAALPAPVTLKTAEVIVPPNVPAPPVTDKPLVVDNTAVPVAADEVMSPKLILVGEVIAIGVEIVTLAEDVRLAAFAAPEKTREVRATAEAIFKEMFICFIFLNFASRGD